MTLPRFIALLLAAGLVLTAIGCGSGSGEGETGAKDADGGSRQFETQTGDNSIQEYGSEAPSSEVDEAAKVVHEYLDARAAGKWKVACDRLAPVTARSLVEQLSAAEGKKKSDCPIALAELTTPVPSSVLRDAAVADVGALRAEGDTGFVLFHGTDGEEFFIAVRREGGHWKVGAIAASRLP